MAYLQVHEKPIRDHTTHETVSLFPTSQPLFHSTHACERYQEHTCLLLRISSFAAKFLPTEYADPTQYGRNSKRSFSRWPAARQVGQAGWSASLRDPPRSVWFPVDLPPSTGISSTQHPFQPLYMSSGDQRQMFLPRVIPHPLS